MRRSIRASTAAAQHMSVTPSTSEADDTSEDASQSTIIVAEATNYRPGSRPTSPVESTISSLVDTLQAADDDHNDPPGASSDAIEAEADETDLQIVAFDGANVSGKQKFAEFAVRRIIGHRENRPDGQPILYGDTREFKVRWFDYKRKDDTWEPESHFMDSVDLLNQYCRSKKIAPAAPNPVVGAIDLGDARNHVRIDLVRAKTLELRQELKPFRSDLPIEIYVQGQQVADHDTIYLLSYLEHCYVLLYFKKDDFFLEADGSNAFQLNKQPIKSLLGGKHIETLAYVGQMNADHCASSAIIIALELGRIHRKGIAPRVIYYERRLKERIEKSLHLYDRVPDPRKLPFYDLAFNEKCNFCNKGFKSRAKLTAHQNFCKQMK